MLTTLLQLLGEGILRDEKNRDISFRDAIVIATSNAGAERIREYIERGYQLEQFEQTFSDCNAVVAMSPLNQKQRAVCPRCHHTLKSGSRWGLHRCSIIAFSILILMPFALSYPLLSVELLDVK